MVDGNEDSKKNEWKIKASSGFGEKLKDGIPPRSPPPRSPGRKPELKMNGL